MQSIFDFDLLKQSIQNGFITLSFDAMSAITGPYAKRILIDLLGAPAESVRNGTPLEDFGGHHPDPNLIHAAIHERKLLPALKHRHAISLHAFDTCNRLMIKHKLLRRIKHRQATPVCVCDAAIR
jgi:phosphoglucomutase